MNNVFCLVVDALAYDYINENNMPFLSYLMKNGHNCTNMYSQGPYTEAALTPFYTGRDNMDAGGNFFRGEESEETLFEVIGKAGYRTFCYTQPLIYPSAMHRGIEYERYGVSYFFSAVYDYRLKYYRDLFLSSEIEEWDLAKLYKLLDDNFRFWLQYLTECKNFASTCNFLNDYSDHSAYDFDRNIALVENEWNAFKNNRKSYLASIYELETRHPVFQIPKYDMGSKANNRALLDSIRHDNAALFNRIEKFNRALGRNSLKSALECSPNLCKAGVLKGMYDISKMVYYRYRLGRTKDTLSEMFEKGPNYKAEPSIGLYFKDFMQWERQTNDGRPYFCMMHVSDLHVPAIFFSLDSTDRSLINAELEAIEECVNMLGEREFNGDILYDLSMRYVDFHIKAIYETLMKEYGEEEIVFMVTADHGSSFKFSPIRSNVVNNCHIENYHIPFVIAGKDGYVAPCIDESFYTTKDISKTIASFCAASFDSSTGKSVLDSRNGGSIAVSEYLGGGCPDITRRPIQFTARNAEWCVYIEQRVCEPFDKGNIRAIFDRRSDPLEVRNLLGEMDIVSKVQPLIEAIEKRWDQLNVGAGPDSLRCLD